MIRVMGSRGVGSGDGVWVDRLIQLAILVVLAVLVVVASVQLERSNDYIRIETPSVSVPVEEGLTT